MKQRVLTLTRSIAMGALLAPFACKALPPQQEEAARPDFSLMAHALAAPSGVRGKMTVDVMIREYGACRGRKVAVDAVIYCRSHGTKNPIWASTAGHYVNLPWMLPNKSMSLECLQTDDSSKHQIWIGILARVKAGFNYGVQLADHIDPRKPPVRLKDFLRKISVPERFAAPADVESLLKTLDADQVHIPPDYGRLTASGNVIDFVDYRIHRIDEPTLEPGESTMRPRRMWVWKSLTDPDSVASFDVGDAFLLDPRSGSFPNLPVILYDSNRVRRYASNASIPSNQYVWLYTVVEERDDTGETEYWRFKSEQPFQLHHIGGGLDHPLMSRGSTTTAPGGI